MKNNLIDLTVGLQKYFDHYELQNDTVSQSTIGWQIDHTLRVINGICITLNKSNPLAYKKKFNFKRCILLLLGFIPRGIANAPKSVQSFETILLHDLKIQSEKALKNILLLDEMHVNSNFPHPYFGQLNLKQSIRFLEIHTKHHLKIIKDIVK